MNIRKCAALLAVAASLCAASTENSSYASHLANAKACETKKQWVVALGEYYEAMLAEPTLAAEEAYHGWTALADDIKSGKPGHGTFDVFEQYDSWIAFMQEYERYWTEHCPRIIVFDMPTRTEINTANRTATYTVGVSWRWSEKYTAMYDVITEGYKKAYTSEWNASYLKDWPRTSVYNAPADKGKFLQNGAALVQSSTDRYKRLASTSSLSIISNRIQSINVGITTLYDIKFSVIDSAKKVIYPSPRTMIDYENHGEAFSLHTFTVSAEQMKSIDSRAIAFFPEALYLKYGNIPAEPKIVEHSRAWVNNLPEVQVSLSKTPFNVKSESTSFYRDVQDYLYHLKTAFENTFAVNVIGKLVKDRQKAEERNRQIIEPKWNEICGTILSKQNSLFTRGTTTARTIESRYFDYEKRYEYNPLAELRTKLTAEYGEEKYEQVKLYMLCNALSKAENLAPVYSVGGANKNLYVDEMEFLLANYDKISCNADANGYRAPTAGEAALYKDVEDSGIIIVRAASTEEKQQQQIIIERKWNENCGFILSKQNLLFTRGTTTARTIESRYFDYEESYRYEYKFLADLRTKLAVEYGEEKYDQVKLYMLCNALSKAENLAPVYSVGGANKNSYVEEMEFLLANYDKISCDTTANGYRAPTTEEATLLADLVSRGGKIIVRPASAKEKQKAAKQQQTFAEERMKDLYATLSKSKSSVGKLYVIRFYDYLRYDNTSNYYNCEMFNEVRTKMTAEYGTEKYERVKLYLLCNSVSKIENLAPAYSVGGTSGKSPYAEEMEFFLTNYDKISCDTKASGYRLPTNKELSTLSKEFHGNFTETDFMVRRIK